ncbi:MAG: UDP-N-acetylglucosamine 1-carboxyvinyltransferase, partial [Alphaproteobacteria bacterium]|nr:UDP-N-acetylglucosamine 1-carboxyvinyltransferase [Alphaproteobacteria bacterium]
MDRIIIRGGKVLNGRLPISGAKNAALTLLPCALLTDEPVTLRNLPRLADVDSFGHLLNQLGVSTMIEGARPEDFGRVMTMRAGRVTSTEAPYDIVRKMRASILVLGPLLARAGEARVSLPGGIYTFPVVSVGATENALMAAVLAKGTCILENAAREPEIVDLCRLLLAMGADIEGVGTDKLVIHGRERLHGATYRVMPDRIEAGSYACAAAITGGSLDLIGANGEDMHAIIAALRDAGVQVDVHKDGIRVSSDGKLKPLTLSTAPFPAFPTDMQAQFMAMLTMADGASVLTETIFENRYMHVPELARMGADIAVN